MHKPVIAQYCCRRLKRLRGCFLMYAASSGFPLCCCCAARCPAGIRGASGKGAGLQRTGEQHSFMDHVSQDTPCPWAAWQKVGRCCLEKLANKWCHFRSTGDVRRFFCLRLQFAFLQLALHGERVQIFDFHLFLFLSRFSSAVLALT